MTYTLIPGQSDQTSEEETMSIIRSVLTEDVDTPEKPQKLAVVETKSAAKEERPAAPRPFVDRTPPPAPRRRASDLPELADTPARIAETPKTPGLLARTVQPLFSALGRVRGFQPTTRHLAIASAALLFVLRPHWFLIGALLVLVLVAGAFATLGSDRIWRALQVWLDRVEARDSDRAARLRTRLDRFACRWDSVLDLFPDGMVDALYMPDFQGMQQAEFAHQQVVADRLNRMAREG